LAVAVRITAVRRCTRITSLPMAYAKPHSGSLINKNTQ